MVKQESRVDSLQINQVNPKLLKFCGAAGLFGTFIVIVTDVIGTIVVDGYNPISQTISNLAIGSFAWIQDVGLNLYSIGLIACAVALGRWNLGDWRWKLGAALLVGLGIDILIISEYDRYANLPQTTGRSVHLYAVYTMGVLLPAICFLLSFGFRQVSRRWQQFNWIIAVVWVIFAPAFFKIPTAIDGLYERFVALILLCWSTAIAWLLFREGSEDS